MYTQCPACLTTFKVSPAQLAVREGRVRCGICSTIFLADQRILEVRQQPDAPESEANERRQRAGKGRRRSGRRRSDKLRVLDEKLAHDGGIPTVTRQPLFGRPRASWSAWLWAIGSVLLLAGLAGQFAYFYRDELATLPEWRPALVEMCHYAGCTLEPPRDIGKIELLETSIAPHPRHENALRLRAQLVNRAAFRQEYPGLEVSLTDKTGRVLARRVFTPIQYSETPPDANLMPNVVARALLDITNPDGKAVGYEVRLVSP